MSTIKKLKIEPFSTEDRKIEYIIYDFESKLNEVIDSVNTLIESLQKGGEKT